MKTVVLTIAIVVGLTCSASAYENFIPLGTGYSTEVDSLAEINSDRDKVIVQADIFETDLYRRAREEKLRESYIGRTFSDPETSGSDFSIDY